MGVLTMSERERDRKVIFEMVKRGTLTLKKAANQCGLSYRQTLRIYQSYLAQGDAGLIHATRGRPSNRKNPHRAEIIKLYQEKYEGFGPTLAAEYLAKDGLIIDHETLRRFLLSEGVWHKKRNRSAYRQRRECRAQFGELVQIDGSIHDWFGIDEHSCLLNMVDDATSKSLSRLAEGETTRVLFEVMRDWIRRYGIPLAVYVDLKSVYISSKSDGFSHFQVACQKLGIRVIKAYSPQAKGRVERKHAVYQDRFVKELALRGVKTIESANAVLSGGFIDDLNAKFEKVARNPNSAHKPLGKIDLEQVFCWEYRRQIQHDWTFEFQGQCYQVHKAYGGFIKPKTSITIRKHLDGAVSAWAEAQSLSIQAITRRPPKMAVPIKKTRVKPVKPGYSAWKNASTFCFQAPYHPKPTTLRRRPH